MLLVMWFDLGGDASLVVGVVTVRVVTAYYNIRSNSIGLLYD